MKNLCNLNSINDPYYFRSLIQGENKLIPFERIIFSKLDISGNVLSFSPPRQKLYPRKPSWNWTPPVLHYTRKLYFHCLRKKEKEKVKDFSDILSFFIRPYSLSKAFSSNYLQTL